MRNSIRLAFGRAGIAHGHLALDINRAAHRIDDAGKLDQHPVAGGFDDAAAVLLDLGIGQFASDRLQGGQRALLILAHQPRIAGNISGEDRGKAAGRGHDFYLIEASRHPYTAELAHQENRGRGQHFAARGRR